VFLKQYYIASNVMKIFNVAQAYLFYDYLFTNTYTLMGATVLVKNIEKTNKHQKLTFQRRQKPLATGGFARDAYAVVGGQMFQSFEHSFVGHGRHGQLRPYPTLATGEHLRTEQFMVLLLLKTTEK
jgi:hypothetical protein